MLDFNLEHLKAFYYAAELKSTTKAAKALYLTQPAISHSIRHLEQHTGVALFERTPKGMNLTREGGVLFEHVAKAFDLIVTGQRKLSLSSKHASGVLRIGVTETTLHYHLLPKIEKFRANYPDSYVHFSGSSTPENLQRLRENKVDLIVVVTPMERSDDIEIMKLTEIQDIFVAGTKFRELTGRTVSPEEIYKHPFVAVENVTAAGLHIVRYFSSHGFFFSPDYSVRTSTSVLPFVEYNMAVGIVPSMFAEELIKQGKIFEIDVSPKIEPREVILVSKRHSQTPPLSQAFMSYFSSDVG